MSELLISDPEKLRQHFGEPNKVAVECIRTSLDQYQKLFIERSPFLCLASADREGQPSISPRGDGPGFIKVVDDVTLIMPDRIGNNKVESFSNIIENPKIALIFFIPAIPETLRIFANASITTDQELLKFAQVGKAPVKTGLFMTITKSYFHCGKALIRSKLWEKESQIEKGVFPPFGKIMKEEAKLTASQEEVEDELQDEYKNELY